ncbi:MAG: aminopeptidase, partial [Frankiaceae bacterium]|nr:aminopeptidase [Frankiaceae bacterium]
MAAENLTRDEARERARLLDVARYDVELDLTLAPTDSPVFRSTSVVQFACTEPGTTTHIDITAHRVLEATLNGTPIDVASAFTGQRLELPALAESNQLRVVADCVFMRTGEGLHRFTDRVDKETYLYTQFETFDAHRMYACFDQPDLKASFTFVVDAPSHWTVVSNMPSTQSEGSSPHRESKR